MGKNVSKNVVTGVIAAAAGFVAGILLAPKSGKETRDDIKRKAGEAKDYAVEQAGVVKEKAAAGFAVLKEGAADVVEEAAGFFNRTGKRTDVIAKELTRRMHRPQGRVSAPSTTRTGRPGKRGDAAGLLNIPVAIV